MIHAYLELTSRDHLLDHEYIALNYRKAMADIIVDIYGVSQQTADALAWQGLFGTSAWQTYKNGHPTEVSYIQNTNLTYHNGTGGTKCN